MNTLRKVKIRIFDYIPMKKLKGRIVYMIYALSDIHGFYDIMVKRLSKLNIADRIMNGEFDDLLIFLGDYIDQGPDSCKTLHYIYELQQKNPENVIVLKGNHEAMFLDFLDGKNDEWLEADFKLNTCATFLKENQLERIKELALERDIKKAVVFTRELIKKNHGGLIAWMRTMPCYYETESQIFVHAGVDEEAGREWKLGTSEEVLLAKNPLTTGKFYKDVIAGHIGTGAISGDPHYHDVFYDGESHYFIDGTVVVSKNIPVLCYDEVTKKYSG